MTRKKEKKIEPVKKLRPVRVGVDENGDFYVVYYSGTGYEFKIIHERMDLGAEWYAEFPASIDIKAVDDNGDIVKVVLQPQPIVLCPDSDDATK